MSVTFTIRNHGPAVRLRLVASDQRGKVIAVEPPRSNWERAQRAPQPCGGACPRHAGEWRGQHPPYREQRPRGRHRRVQFGGEDVHRNPEIAGLGAWRQRYRSAHRLTR
jgi:hypothetical protein